MKRLTRTLPLILAALLQLLPLLRNIVTSPAAGSSFAIILRWGIGSAAALETVDAVSGATNFFAGPSNYVGTASVYFTNNLTLTVKTSGDGGALCTLTSSTATNVLSNGQTTTNSMPTGLTFKFIDRNTGNSSFTNVYCIISGTPTQIGTNAFHVYLFYQAGVLPVDGDFKIAIQAASSGSAPTITNQPASLTNNVGSNVTFTVTAGTAPLSYQWYFNTNTALLNATNTSLSLTNIQLTNAGTYSVIITNTSGSVTSSFALLTVWQPPVITNQPVNVTANVGSSATFSVTNGGTAPFKYQWYFNTNTALLNQTNASVTLTNIQLTNAGTYSVAITNSAGSTNSSYALLTVWQPPVITNQPVSLTNNVGSSATFSVTNGGTAPFKYQWYFNTNTALLNQTNASVTLANIQFTNAGTYSVAITNSAGSTNSSYALLTVWQPPIITNQPVGYTNMAGCSRTFSVGASGVPALGYQWRLTSTGLTGAAAATLSLTNILTSQAGAYTVVITNSAGSVTSSVANLVVTNPPPPAVTGGVVKSSGAFQFTFTPVVGLTNTVLTNGTLFGGTWNVFTNLPPSASASPITLTNLSGSANLFYRVMIQP